MRQLLTGATLALAVVLAPEARAQEVAPLPPLPPPSYAPPAPPVAPPAPPIPTGRTDEVRFEPDEPGLRLFMRSGMVPVRRIERFRDRFRTIEYIERGYAPSYTPLCDGPCARPLMPGEYHLALSRFGGRPVAAGAVVLNGPSTIHGDYIDRSGLRTAGTILGIAGVIGGIVMIVASVHGQQVCDDTGYCYSQETASAPLLVGGIGVVIGSAIVGSILALQRDEAHVTVSPLTLPAVGRLKESPVAAIAGAPAPQGAALTIRF